MTLNPERMAPADQQQGAPLAGPLAWPAAALPPPRSVLALGLASMSYLNKAVLLELFGYEGVRRAEAGAPLPASAAGESVVLAVLPEGRRLTWPEFADWLGRRWAVVDVRAAAAMLTAAGIPVRTAAETGDRAGALTVMRCRMSAPVYPNAPRVRIAADSDLTRGFPVTAEVHLYAPVSGDKLALEGLVPDAALDRVVRDLGGCVAGTTVGSGLAALLTIPTPAGGCVSIMDLAAVNRMPEPSGAETPAVQFFLNGLGWGTAVFGAFCRAVPKYEDFVEIVAGLAARHPDLARLDTIGRSAGGRPIVRLRVGRAAARPAVLFTCGIHPFEWGNAYGLLRYTAFLLEQAAADTAYARYLLGARQVHWIPSVVPDGWESRDQPVSGLNHNRNFPGGWELCRPGERAWDTYNKRYAPEDPNPDITRGPGPGSEPETRALMGLLDRAAEPVAALGDFHETTAPESFLHPHEEPDGSVREWPYHHDLADSVAEVFDGRFVSHANVLAFGPGLSDFPSYRLRRRVSLRTPITNAQSAWIHYALGKLPHALVIEASGADATNYQTLRRTEYAALAAEQILAAEGGRLLRNPWPEPRETAIAPARTPARVSAHIMDGRGHAVEHRSLPAEKPWSLTLPAGGWAWLDYA
jgi:hypothetical protein